VDRTQNDRLSTLSADVNTLKEQLERAFYQTVKSTGGDGSAQAKPAPFRGMIFKGK